MSLAFVRGIHPWPVNSLHKWPVTRKMFPIDDIIMEIIKINQCSWSNPEGYGWNQAVPHNETQQIVQTYAVNNCGHKGHVLT